MMMLMILAAFSEFLMNLKSEVPSSVDVVVSLIKTMGADGVGCSFGWVHHLLAPKPSMGIQGNNDLCSARLTPFPKLTCVHSLTFKSCIHACGLVVMTNVIHSPLLSEHNMLPLLSEDCNHVFV